MNAGCSGQGGLVGADCRASGSRTSNKALAGNERNSMLSLVPPKLPARPSPRSVSRSWLLLECSGVPRRVGPEWSARTRTLSKQDFPTLRFQGRGRTARHGQPLLREGAGRSDCRNPGPRIWPSQLRSRSALSATSPARWEPVHPWSAVSGAQLN